MRRLHLHVGHGKTGTSWIQAALARSQATLRETGGIDYPDRAGSETARETEAARITSGNGGGVLASADAAARALADHAGGTDLLFSSEWLFSEVLNLEDLSFLPDLARAHGFEKVRVLLFIRDPLEMVASIWQQDVKRGGEVRSLEDVYDAPTITAQAARFLDLVGRVPEIELTIRNYSRCSDRLLAVFAEWLGVPEEALSPPPATRVNRGLAAGELVLQRTLNARLGGCGHLLADPLCERLPDQPTEAPRPSEAAQRRAWERMSPDIERVNAVAPEAHRYRFDLAPETAKATSHPMTEAQLELVAQSLGGEIARLRAELKRLRTRPETLPARALARGLVRKVRGKLGA